MTATLSSQIALETQTIEALHEKLTTLALKSQQNAFRQKDASHLPQGITFTTNLYHELLKHLGEYVQAEEGKRRRSSFYVHVIAPAMAAYADIQSNRFKKDLFSNPLKIIAWSIASQASSIIINAEGYIKVTTMSRCVVDAIKSSYGMGFTAEKNEIAGMTQLIRTCLTDSSFLYEYPLQCKTVVLALTPDYQHLRTDKDVLHEVLVNKIESSVAYKPMIIEPTPHRTLVDSNGGYITLQSPLVKFPNHKHCNYTCTDSLIRKLNALQATAWNIDADYMKWLSDNDFDFLDFDINCMIDHRKLFADSTKEEIKSSTTELFALRKNRKNLEGDAKESNIAQCKVLEDLLNEYATKASDLESMIGKYSAFEATYTIAKEYAQYPEFYLPPHIDDRGRVYTYCTALDFQGNKLAKSLVGVAKRERMNEKGLRELYIALGACFDGFDKLKYEGRIQAVTDNMAGIFAFMEGGDQSVLTKIDDDELYVAVRLMYELYHHMTNAEYKTGVIVYIDSCSSAIQIQALLQRDKSSAALTNIIESEGTKLADAYKIVADGCLTLVTDMARDSNEELLAKMTAYISLNQPNRG